jgi:hypothetical protein
MAIAIPVYAITRISKVIYLYMTSLYAERNKRVALISKFFMGPDGKFNKLLDKLSIFHSAHTRTLWQEDTKIRNISASRPFEETPLRRVFVADNSEATSDINNETDEEVND